VPTLHVVVPALNEAANIRRVLDDLRAAGARHAERFALSLVLIDDGSSDGTGELACELAGNLDLTLVHHDTPRGPGRAFASGFRHLAPLVADDDYVLTLEADNTSRLELVDAMFRRIDEGYDAVFASPYMYGGGILQTSPLRVVLSHLANTFVKEFLGIRGLLTVSSFFRLYRGEAVRRLQSHFGPEIVERSGFECMVEMALKLVYLRMRIAELPMVLDTSRRIGKSKMGLTATGLGYLALFRRKAAWQEMASLAAPVSPEGEPLPRGDTIEVGAPVAHSHYDHYSAEMVRRLNGVFGLVDARANERIAAHVIGHDVLDLGCGFGSLVDHLRRRGLAAVGIDILDSQITAGRERFPEADLRLVEIGPLPFADSSFDTVVLKESLHHLAAEGDIDDAMSELARICRRRVVVFEPNASVPLKLGRTLIGHVDPICPAPMARGFLEHAGFTVQSVTHSDALAFPLSGGYVSRPLLPRRAAALALRLDDALVRRLGQRVAWRYLMVADKSEALERRPSQ
jgi:dolichol-phosphate mannosyltransferase